MDSFSVFKGQITKLNKLIDLGRAEHLGQSVEDNQTIFFVGLMEMGRFETLL